MIGKVLKELRVERPLIATKCGISWDHSGKVNRWVNAKQVRREIEASLKRIGVDVIDLYQVHWPYPDKLIEETWAEMAKLVREGKVRYIGISNYSLDQIKRVQAIHPVTSLQSRYSMIHRELEDEILPYCEKNHIGFLAYSPMAKGILTGKVSPGWVDALASDDHRKNDPDFLGRKLNSHLKFVEELKPIALRNGKTLAQLALAWVLRRKEVTSAIAGARNPAQIEETAKVGDIVLGKDDVSEIDVLLKKYERQAATK